MKRHQGQCGASLLLLCLLPGAVLLSSATPVCAALQRLVLLHTANVQGHVFPLRFREWRDYEGGLLRCASMVESIRRTGDPVLLLDAGGWIEGSPESYLSNGLLPFQAACAMRYDARVLSPGDEQTGASHYHAEVPLLAADLERPAGATVRAEPFVVRDLGGVRVAVLGLAGRAACERCGAAWSPAAARRMFDETMRQIRRERPDVLVLAAQLGCPGDASEEGALLAWAMERYPEIDLVIGAGSGRLVRQAVRGATPYTQAGPHARWLGRVDLLFDTASRRLLSVEADAIEIGPGVDEDANLSRALGASLGRIAQELDRTIGRTPRALDRSSGGAGLAPVQGLVAEAVRLETGADRVVLAREAPGGLAAGAVTRRDVLRAVDLLPGLVRVDLTESELDRLLARRIQASGATPAFGVYRDPASDGIEAGPERRLRVVMDARLFAACTDGGGDAAAGEEAVGLERVDIDARALVTEYIRDRDATSP